MGLEMDLLDGALFAQAQAKQDPNSLAAKLTGAGVPWAEEAKKRQSQQSDKNTPLMTEAKKRRAKAAQAKEDDEDREIIQRVHKGDVKLPSHEDIENAFYPGGREHHERRRGDEDFYQNIERRKRQSDAAQSQFKEINRLYSKQHGLTR